MRLWQFRANTKIIVILVVFLVFESVAQCEFENYFKELIRDENTNHAQQKIEEALRSIIARVKVPYVDDDGIVKDQGYFEKIEKKVHQRDPEAKVYASGGVVRCLLQ